MRARLRWLAWVHLVIGAAGLCLCAAFIAAFALARDAEYANEAAFFGWLLGWAAAICFLPSFFGGLGLLRGKRWGRAILWIESALLAIVVPVGTMLAGFTVWALLSTVDLSANGGMADIERGLRRATRALGLALVALFLLGVMLGVGYLFRDVIDPPVPQNLTPMPDGRPPSVQPMQVPPDL